MGFVFYFPGEEVNKMSNEGFFFGRGVVKGTVARELFLN